MDNVEEYRELLRNLQSVWDNLTMLGQLSGTGTDMSGTRHAFAELTGTLLNQLGHEELRTCRQEMSAKAQVAIDILVRNLFERTADIGFLACDADIRQFIGKVHECAGNVLLTRDLAAARTQLRARFAEYAAKYTVYSDIVLTDTEGHILLRLDDATAPAQSHDALIADALATDAGYVETFRAVDFLPTQTQSLVYSCRVCDDAGKAIGVLSLVFRFDDEMQRIFDGLLTADDWAVILVVDADHRVIASSDRFHVPLGARLPCPDGPEVQRLRFAAREYLAMRCPSRGYQGYAGPGWCGLVMLPVEHAFAREAAAPLRALGDEVRSAIMSSPTLFSEQLRRIPEQADRIQRALNPAFSKILLWEISNTGDRTRDVFERSIANLHETVVSAILHDSRFAASLAIDILDRNLYERANDCRWWALTSVFREVLAAPIDDAGRQRVTEVLRYIHSLYTVYANLLVFDTQGVVVAESGSTVGGASWSGRAPGEDWVRRTLALDDSQAWAVSAFAPSALYGNAPTYIYGAALRAPSAGDEKAPVIGGVAVVFDSAPQLLAMLRDCLPRGADGAVRNGCFAAFIDAEAQVIACTDERWRPGHRPPEAVEALALADDGSGVLRIDDQYFAVGVANSHGYREYGSGANAARTRVTALVFMPLCAVAVQSATASCMAPAIRGDASSDDTVEIATFRVGRNWFGLRSEKVIEAVDAAGLTGVPGAGETMAGYLMYDGVPIAVFDIASMLHDDEAVPSTSDDSTRQVLVLRRDDDTRIGILADALGDIPEVSTARLRQIPAMLAGGNVLGESVLGGSGDGDEALLLVLGVERIVNRLAGGSTPPAAAIPLPRREAAAAR
ncbi:MAG: chemotaxis protein CheW [Methyloversatilis sp.]|uniref:chemotaxis protein CheW n=1 Tax=Methyloversatilis sp. TaxID=2569862 RepID=UPI0025ECD34B|nr:chemotaxis protein CheW [Methyloversatilis sp.]MCR6666860.1 chemotaxis protein CheW [Methyloversatilis sp.]